MRRGCFPMVACLLVVLQGCAGSFHLSKSETQSMRAIQVAHYETPGLMKKTMKTEAIAIASMGFGAIGSMVGANASMGIAGKEGRQLTEAYGLPDFGDMVFKGFVEKLRENVPKSPELQVLDNPIDDEYRAPDSAHLITVQVVMVAIDDWNGLSARTIGKVISPRGSVIWEKIYNYKTTDFSGQYSLKELEADNGSLLKQEIARAAEKTVSVLFVNLTGLPSVDPPQQTRPDVNASSLQL